MEQNISAEMPMMNNDKLGNGKGLKIVTAVACAVAICGIGFGVYGMIQSSKKDNQISDLKVQIKGLDNNATIAEVEAPSNESGAESEGSEGLIPTRVCTGVYNGNTAIGQDAITKEYVNGNLSITLNDDGTYDLSKENTNGEKGSYTIIEDVLLLKTAPHTCGPDPIDCPAEYSHFLHISEDCSEISGGYGPLFFNSDFTLTK